MKTVVIAVIGILALTIPALPQGHAEILPMPHGKIAGMVDVNKDGVPDVTYYQDGEYISQVEADTNYDGKPDVVMHIKDGKFESAEVDTNYDGKPDKTFTDAKEFSRWVNENHPAFSDSLNKQDWRATVKF